MTPPTRQATHEVLNQVPPLAGHDVAADPALLAGLHREGGSWAAAELHELGALAGAPGTQERARLANSSRRCCAPMTRPGTGSTRSSSIRPGIELMAVAVQHGLHAAPWADDRPGAHVARAAKFYVWTQAEGGHGCPISMTYASVPALRHAPQLAAGWSRCWLPLRMIRACAIPRPRPGCWPAWR